MGHILPSHLIGSFCSTFLDHVQNLFIRVPFPEDTLLSRSCRRLKRVYFQKMGCVKQEEVEQLRASLDEQLAEFSRSIDQNAKARRIVVVERNAAQSVFCVGGEVRKFLRDVWEITVEAT